MWNMFKGNNKNTRAKSVTSFWGFYCWLWTYLTPSFSSVFVVEFEQVNVRWQRSRLPQGNSKRLLLLLTSSTHPVHTRRHSNVVLQLCLRRNVVPLYNNFLPTLKKTASIKRRPTDVVIFLIKRRCNADARTILNAVILLLKRRCN